MALLMVITTVAVLTSVVVEFAYSTHVDLRLAANARDALRAEYLARSATNFSRLVLGLQGQINGMTSQIPGLPMGNIQLASLLPIDSDLIKTFMDSASAEPEEDPDIPEPPLSPEPGELIPAANLLPFGSYQGSFRAEIINEEAKINLNKLNNPGTSGTETALTLLQLLMDERWDFLFEEENLHRERVTREELVVRIRDWIDENEVEQALDPGVVTGIFVDTASDEERHYVRYPDRYRPKNALFDTMEELHLVAGMSDRIYAAFGEMFTVFPDINARISLDTDNPLMLLNLLRVMSADPNHMAFTNEHTVESMLRELMLLKSASLFSPPTAEQFAAILVMHGLTPRPDIDTQFSTTSNTYRIEATGQVGDVSRTVTAVIRLDDRLGKLLYFRED